MSAAGHISTQSILAVPVGCGDRRNRNCKIVGCSDGVGRLAGLLNQLEELIFSKYGNKLPRELAYWLIVLDVNPVIHAAHKTHSLS